VLAGRERGKRDRDMENVGYRDGNGLDFRIGKEILVVPIDVRDIVGRRQLPAALVVKAGNGDDFDAGILRKTLQMENADTTTYDSNLEFPRIGHYPPFPT
jgi:hypothetical protein